MSRYSRPASAVRRIRNRLIPGAGAAVALIIAWVISAPGTYTFWEDRATVHDVTLTAGHPSLSVSGFEKLDHDYEANALSAQADVTVRNTGDVPLKDFVVTHSLIGEDSSAQLDSAIDTRFVPQDDDPGTDWAGWLSGLTLGPGDDRSYTVTTTLDAGELADLHEQQVIVEVTVQARAGTAWTVIAENGFAQAVFHEPPANEDDFNARFNVHSSHSLEFMWDVALPQSGVAFNVYMRRPGEQTRYLLGSAADWYPAMTISSSSIPSALVPGLGATAPVVVEAVRVSDSTVVARGTLWLTGIGGGQATMATTGVRATAAPLGRALDAAQSAPQASTPAPEPPAGPAAELPVVPVEPEPVVPEPVEPDPVEPEPGEPATPLEPPAITAVVEPDGSALVLGWRDPAEVPEGARFGLRHGEDLVAESDDGRLVVDSGTVPPELWNAEGTPFEVTVVIVGADGTLSPTDLVIRVTPTETRGEFTFGVEEAGG
jgi:hypothetical protein